MQRSRSLCKNRTVTVPGLRAVAACLKTRHFIAQRILYSVLKMLIWSNCIQHYDRLYIRFYVLMWWIKRVVGESKQFQPPFHMQFPNNGGVKFSKAAFLIQLFQRRDQIWCRKQKARTYSILAFMRCDSSLTNENGSESTGSRSVWLLTKERCPDPDKFHWPCGQHKGIPRYQLF